MDGPRRRRAVRSRAGPRRQRRLEQRSSCAARRRGPDRSPTESSTAPRGRCRPRGASSAALDGASPEPDAVGHRIVHGGERFREAVLIDAAVEQALRELDRARAAAPAEVAGRARRRRAGRCPGVPAVACFDTAFHATLPPAAATYALPAAWRERWGCGATASTASRTPGSRSGAASCSAASRAALRIVSCHLGAGASLCAIADGRSVDTTMGFTPLEGLVMATRSGSVDPGLLLWLLEHGEPDERRAGRRARARLRAARPRPAPPTCATIVDAGGRRRAGGPGSRSTSTSTGCGRDRRDGRRARRARRARLHRRRRRALGPGARPRRRGPRLPGRRGGQRPECERHTRCGHLHRRRLRPDTRGHRSRGPGDGGSGAHAAGSRSTMEAGGSPGLHHARNVSTPGWRVR